MSYISNAQRSIDGKELEILASLRIPSSDRRHIRCPFPDHSDRNPSWRWDAGKKRYFCTCGSGDIYDMIKGIKGVEFSEAVRYAKTALRSGTTGQPAQRPHKVPARSSSPSSRWSGYAEQLWHSCKPLGGVATEYLTARGCVIPPLEGDLRWHSELHNKIENWTGPALVGRVTDAVTNTPMTLHRTWIARNGDNVPMAKARVLLKGHAKAGGVIRLWPDDSVSLGLGIAEGIETALAAAHGFTPMWAAIDAGNLAKFPVLHGIEVLTIFADNDDAGIRSADCCAESWLSSGAEVRMSLSSRPGEDFNDWLRS